MAAKKEKKENTKAKETEKPTCGIIMPISSIDSYSAEHWSEVKQIIIDVIDAAGFSGKLVSDAEETSIIQKTIVHNVYKNEIVICDVSGKNPNVMFELGMRLAFDKATIIIKDNETDYSFDTSPIEHLTYPRDLRFFSIVKFKDDLKKKLLATHKKATTDSNYSTFLKSFGEFKIAHLESKEVSSDEFIIESLKVLAGDIKELKRTTRQNSRPVLVRTTPEGRQYFDNADDQLINNIILSFAKGTTRQEIDKAISVLTEDLGYSILGTGLLRTMEGLYNLDIGLGRPITEAGANRMIRLLREQRIEATDWEKIG